jgi:hypothetical protein
VAIFSSSVPHFVLSALKIGSKISIKTHKGKSKGRSSPNVRAGSDLGLEELFEIFEEFVLLRTALHDSDWHVRVALRLSVLGAAARDRFTSVFVHAPAVSRRPIALDSLVAAVDGAFGQKKLILWRACGEVVSQLQSLYSRFCPPTHSCGP